MFQLFLESLILVIAISIDTFAACFAYGMEQVKIPPSSVCIIGGITSGILLAFLLLGNLFGSILPENLTRILSFLVLTAIALIKLFDESIKAFIRKYHSSSKKWHFSFRELNFILTVYACPEHANSKKDNLLSPMEALSLAAALSFDSAAVGIGAGVSDSAPICTSLLCFLVGSLAAVSGSFLGNKLSARLPHNFSLCSCFLLLLLAFTRLS